MSGRHYLSKIVCQNAAHYLKLEYVPKWHI
jgi:hypothetical protein